MGDLIFTLLLELKSWRYITFLYKSELPTVRDILLYESPFSFVNTLECTVNKLIFPTILIGGLPEMNRFVATKFRNRASSVIFFNYSYMAARYGPSEKYSKQWSSSKPCKNSSHANKVGSQYVFILYVWLMCRVVY